MKNYKIYLLSLILILNVEIAAGQDIHFSKFFSAPFILNPANTTNYHGNWNLISNYRQQGISTPDPYITSTFAFDYPIYVKSERAGVGIIWINDKSANNTLSVNKIFASAAYFRKISRKSYLHLGLQAGYVHKILDFSNLTYPDQFDMTSGYFNSNLNTEETLQKSSLSYLDLNWGLIWSYKAPKFTSEIGVAMFHYNTPYESFSTNKFILKPRYVYHAFFEKLLFNNYFVKPKFLYVNQNSASEMLIGLDVGLFFLENRITNKFYVGGFFRGGFKRNPDAFIIKTGFNYKNFDISVGYDIEIPGHDLFIYTKSSFELSISFRRPETNVTNKTIPCSIF